MDERTAADLLRRFEPILRLNRGERFFPMDVSRYVERAGLWLRPRGEAPRCLVPAGSLSLDDLANPPRVEEGNVLFLRATAPMSPAEIARHALREKLHRKDPHDEFRAGRGRLARVGYTSRVLDAVFSLSLLARGRVPGDFATAAAVAYRSEMNVPERYRYCGRVVEQDHWVVLQYWCFYAFNDWRSRFFGVNDHEGDWELVTVVLDGAATDRQPEWVVCSCHDYTGEELRRRWSDPAVHKEGDHPVVYVAAGSHAGYHREGEYLAEVQVPFMRPAARVFETMRRVWRDRLHQYVETAPGEPSERAASPLLRVPFVDYARGDGHAIGPGQERTWDPPVLFSPDPGWVESFRGLWGYHAADPLSGEDAPPGPMYERDGTVRLAWRDPVAWCGLTGTPPPSRRLTLATRVRSTLQDRLRERATRIAEIREQLLRTGVEVDAIADAPHLAGRERELRARAEDLGAELNRLESAREDDANTVGALDERIGLLRTGAEPPVPHAGAHPREPLSPDQLRAGKLAETWAAISVSVMLLGLVGLVTLGSEYLVFGVLALTLWFILIEATFRGRLTRVITTLTIGAALLATAVLVTEFFQPLALTLVIALGLYMLWENLKELWT